MHLPWTEVVEAVNMQTSDVPHTRVWPSPRPQLTTTNINVILLVLYTILPPMNRLMRKWSMDHLSCMRPIIVTFPVKATTGSNEWTGTSSAPCHAVEQERPKACYMASVCRRYSCSVVRSGEFGQWPLYHGTTSVNMYLHRAHHHQAAATQHPNFVGLVPCNMALSLVLAGNSTAPCCPVARSQKQMRSGD